MPEGLAVLLRRGLGSSLRFPAVTLGRQTTAPQSMGLMGPKLDEREVALWLRTCPGLAKTTIGELLGEPSEFWLKVLAHFVGTFDFTGAAAHSIFVGEGGGVSPISVRYFCSGCTPAGRAPLEAPQLIFLSDATIGVMP